MTTKRTIKGKTYNVATAERCAFGVWKRSLTLDYVFRGVYRTKRGDYFVHDLATDRWHPDEIFPVSEDGAQHLIGRLEAQDGVSLHTAIECAANTADPTLDFYDWERQEATS